MGSNELECDGRSLFEPGESPDKPSISSESIRGHGIGFAGATDGAMEMWELDEASCRVRGVYRDYAASGFAERWNPSHIGNRMMVEERHAATRALLAAAGFHPLGQFDILEIGCGGGDNLAMLVAEGADPERTVGIDIFVPALAEARRRLPGCRLFPADAGVFSLGPGSVDLILLHTVISSVREESAMNAIAARAIEMLRPGGAVLWYDFFIKNPLNRHTRPIGARTIRRLFPGFALDLRTITLLPPLSRRLTPRTAWLYPRLSRFTLLRGHYFGLLRAPRL